MRQEERRNDDVCVKKKKLKTTQKMKLQRTSSATTSSAALVVIQYRQHDIYGNVVPVIIFKSAILMLKRTNTHCNKQMLLRVPYHDEEKCLGPIRPSDHPFHVESVNVAFGDV